MRATQSQRDELVLSHRTSLGCPQETGYSAHPLSTVAIRTLPHNFSAFPGRASCVALKVHRCPSPRHSVPESSQMLFTLEDDMALGLQSNLQKQGQIPKPEAAEISHLSSCGNDSSFRDEKSSLTQHRRLIYRWLIPLCTMAKSTLASGLVWWGRYHGWWVLGTFPSAWVFSGFLGEAS